MRLTFNRRKFKHRGLRIFRRTHQRLIVLSNHHRPIVQQKAIVIYHNNILPYWQKYQYYIKKNRLFSTVVLTPWLLFAAYILLIESPTYQSTTKIIIEKDMDLNPMKMGGGLLGLSGGLANSETILTQEHLTSREVVHNLQKLAQLKDHFQDRDIDMLSRLKTNPTEKEYLSYFQKMVSAIVDTQTGEINISVKAFSAQEAQLIAGLLIKEARGFVNRVSNNVAEKQYSFAAEQLKAAKDKLFKISHEVLQWQNEHGQFDPKESTKIVGNVMAELKSKLVEKQTQLITYSSYMQPESSKVVALQEEIKAIQTQIKQQTQDLLSEQKGSVGLNKVLRDYQLLQLKLKFAQADYEAAQQVFSTSAVNAAKQNNSVIEIEPPNLPDESDYNHKIYDLISILIYLLVLFFLTKMTINIVHEHVD